MLKKLIKLANDLDLRGLTKEADLLDQIINKMAGAWSNLTVSPQEAFKKLTDTPEKFSAYPEEHLGELYEILLDKKVVNDVESFLNYLKDNGYIDYHMLYGQDELKGKLDILRGKLNSYLNSDRARELRAECQPLTEDQIKNLLILSAKPYGMYAFETISHNLRDLLKDYKADEKESPICFNIHLEQYEQEMANTDYKQLLEQEGGLKGIKEKEYLTNVRRISDLVNNNMKSPQEGEADKKEEHDRIENAIAEFEKTILEVESRFTKSANYLGSKILKSATNGDCFVLTAPQMSSLLIAHAAPSGEHQNFKLSESTLSKIKESKNPCYEDLTEEEKRIADTDSTEIARTIFYKS